MKVRGIDFVFTAVSDVSKARSFYTEVLGIQDPIIGAADSWTEFDTKPVALALGSGDWVKPPQTAPALAVEDVHAAIEELKQKGVKILMEPMDSPVCITAFIADPDGNPIFLHQRKDGTAG